MNSTDDSAAWGTRSVVDVHNADSSAESIRRQPEPVFCRPRHGLGWLSFRELTVMAVATAICGLVWTLPQFTWLPSRWVDTSAAFRQALLISAPVAMVSAAWVARCRWSAVCGKVPGRGWSDISKRHLFSIGTATTLGYVCGLAPLVVRTVFRASAGGPAWFVIVSGLALLNTWMVLGYLVGAVVRAPLSYIACFAVVGCIGFLVPGVVQSYAQHGVAGFAVLPWWTLAAPIETHEVVSVAAFRVMWTVALAAALVWLVGRLGCPLRGRGVAQRLHSGVTALMVPALLVSVGVVRDPVAIALDDPLIGVCAMADAGVSVCVPSDQADLLPLAIEIADGVIKVSGTAQLSAMGPADMVRSIRPATPVAYRQDITSMVILHLAGPTRDDCMFDSSGQLTGHGIALAAVQQTLMQRVVWNPGGFPDHRSDDSTPDGRLARLADGDLKAWLDKHGDALRACEITVTDLP